MPNENLLKVNLIVKAGNGRNGEGVWAETVTPEDKVIYDDESRKGEIFKVKILNHPITTNDISRGDIVDVVNMGCQRAVLAKPCDPQL